MSPIGQAISEPIRHKDFHFAFIYYREMYFMLSHENVNSIDLFDMHINHFGIILFQSFT